MKIFILESLRNTDPNLGELVHNYLSSKGIDNQYDKFSSKQELLDLLSRIKVNIGNGGLKPFVHFVCHGNKDGIGVQKLDNSEELITWEEIGDAFIDIYMSSKQKSVICMSSCNGFNAVKLVARFKPCPYDHVCGSFESISFSDAYEGYTKFYDLILSGKSIFDSAVEIHNDPNFVDLQFLGINSPTLFRLTVDGYLKEKCTEEKLAIEKEKYKRILLLAGQLTPYQEEYLESVFSLEGQKLILENYAKIFFSLE